LNEIAHIPNAELGIGVLERFQGSNPAANSTCLGSALAPLRLECVCCRVLSDFALAGEYHGLGYAHILFDRLHMRLLVNETRDVLRVGWTKRLMNTEVNVDITRSDRSRFKFKNIAETRLPPNALRCSPGHEETSH
jgi:hypothetical protein